VFYHVFTGRRPFDAAGLPAVLKKVIMDDPPPIREYEAPAGLAGILMRALQKDPERRYQRVPEMAADLIRLKREGNLDVLQSRPAVEERQPEIHPDMETAADPRASAATIGMKTTAFPLTADASESDGAASTDIGTAATGGLRDPEGGAVSADPAPPIR
jgi:serine/threonine protein kinase